MSRGLAWRTNANTRGWQAEEAYRYLSEPIAVTKDGKTITRKDVLDILIGRTLQPPPAATK